MNEPTRRAALRVDSPALSIREDGRHRRVWGHAVGLSAATVLFSACAAALLTPDATIAAFALWMTSLGAMLATAVSAFQFLLSAGRCSLPEASGLEVSATELVIHGRLSPAIRIRVADIEQGWLEEPSTVVLGTVDGLVVAAHVDEPEQRAALLEAIGVSVGQSVVRVPIGGIASQIPLGGALRSALTLAVIALPVILAIVLALALHEGVSGGEIARDMGALEYAGIVALASMLAVAGARVVSRLAGPRHAVVGTDGVAVLGLGRSFYPYAEMLTATPAERGVEIEMKNGQSVLLPTADRVGPFPHAAGVRRQVLLDAIRRAAAGARAHVATVKLDLLDRKGRPVRAWREALQNLSGSGGDYRVSVLTRDELSEVVADGAAPAERRIAAAYALSSADPETKHRLRIAVDACANEDLRSALAHAAEGELDDAEIRRAGLTHER